MGSGWRGGSPICPVCPAPSRAGLATPPSGPVSTRIILGAPELRLPLEQSRACWPWTPLQGQASLGVPVRPQGHWWFTCPECSRCCCLGELTLPPAWVPGGAEPLSSGALGGPCPQRRPFPLLTRGPWQRPQLAVSPHLLGRGPCHCEAVPRPCVYMVATERAVMLPASWRGTGMGVPLRPGLWAGCLATSLGPGSKRRVPTLPREGLSAKAPPGGSTACPSSRRPIASHSPTPQALGSPRPIPGSALHVCGAGLPSRGPLAQRAPVAHQGDLPRARGHVSPQ